MDGDNKRKEKRRGKGDRRGGGSTKLRVCGEPIPKEETIKNRLTVNPLMHTAPLDLNK